MQSAKPISAEQVGASSHLHLSPHARVYLSFLNIRDRYLQQAAAEVTPKERALLDCILAAWVAGTPMTITMAILLTQHGSSSTVHKRIQRLKQLGLLASEPVQTRKSMKILSPGPQALPLYQELARCQHLACGLGNAAAAEDKALSSGQLNA